MTDNQDTNGHKSPSEVRDMFGKEVFVKEYIFKDFGSWHKKSFADPVKGIVIGKRTLAEGNCDYETDLGFVFTPERHFAAYLVAFDMYRKPVHVTHFHDAR